VLDDVTQQPLCPRLSTRQLAVVNGISRLAYLGMWGNTTVFRSWLRWSSSWRVQGRIQMRGVLD
jgi:hypothetical protein